MVNLLHSEIEDSHCNFELHTYRMAIFIEQNNIMETDLTLKEIYDLF